MQSTPFSKNKQTNKQIIAKTKHSLDLVQNLE